MDSVRATRRATLTLDAGDVMTGNPITEIAYRGALGGALFEMMNRMGYDVWSPGNHDLDISQENLVALTRIARFPTVCANMVNDRGEFHLNNRPYLVVERGGIRIGIIGIMAQFLSELVIQSNLEGIRVLSPAETLQKYIDELDAKTDLLIAITHEGFSADSVLATAVSGLDVIVGGHSHTRLERPRRVNDVIIVQAGSNAERLGVLDLTVDGDRVVRHEGRLITLWNGAPRPATPVSSLVDSMRTEVERAFSEVIGTLTADWVRGGSETAIGSFISEAQRAAALADVAFMNVHGIRKDMPAGPITRKDLYEILPFRNYLTTFKLTGRQLLDVLRFYVTSKPAIHIAGLRAEWLPFGNGEIMFKNIMVGGAPLEMDKDYTCTAGDYFVGEAQRYLGLVPSDVVYSQKTLYEVVEAAIRKQQTITPVVLYRVRRSS
jgi:2',3'-cyclic-nucleotide 2'-phosphodiesterase (5'-nucleotidase family)